MRLRLSSVTWLLSLDHSTWPCVHSVLRTSTLILSLRQIKRKTRAVISLVYSRRDIRYTSMTMTMRRSRWPGGWGFGSPLENFNLSKSHNKITKLPIPHSRKSLDRRMMTLYWNRIHLLYLYHCGLGLLWLHALCNLEKHKETQKCVKKIIQPLIENRLVIRRNLTTLGSVFDFIFWSSFSSAYIMK